MDHLEAEILEKACAVMDEYVDVNFKSDRQIQMTVKQLVERGWVTMDFDCRIFATDKGRVALSDYHQALKDASKQEAKASAKEREQERKNLIERIAKAVFDFFLRFF